MTDKINCKITKEKNSKYELDITIDNKTFLTYWNNAMKNISAEIEIDGFRKGNVPEDIIISKYGEMIILEEMANLSINDTYPQAIIENNIKVISAPHIHIVKLSKADDFVYHAHVDVYPDIQITNYKKLVEEVLAEKKDITETTQEEIDNILKSLDEKVKTETEDIENKIKENLKLEKEYAEKSRLRALFIDKLTKEYAEKDKDYWPESWDEKHKSQYIILNISESEKISISDESIEAEMLKMLAGIDPKTIPEYNEDQFRNYVRQILINEETFKKLGL